MNTRNVYRSSRVRFVAMGVSGNVAHDVSSPSVGPTTMMLFGGSIIDGDPYVTMGARNAIVVPATLIVAGRDAIAAGMIVSTSMERTSGIVEYVDAMIRPPTDQ